ncbi:hypothetical protein [Arenibacter certesii]|uniref:Class I SAM-dependent methyltransferase n=1 Tax=Arenibacter certesii TaxID=228955 RepID=A0A918IZ68_9FLAO|nr:hypothetical protein [Arenibacter certesii]GGW39394.1 hypothetical protein GCM10007383_25160 [Arenibacter certesii]
MGVDFNENKCSIKPSNELTSYVKRAASRLLAYQDKCIELDGYNTTFTQLITKRNPTFLETGCGPGNITRYLLKKGPILIFRL